MQAYIWAHLFQGDTRSVLIHSSTLVWPTVQNGYAAVVLSRKRAISFVLPSSRTMTTDQ